MKRYAFYYYAETQELLDKQFLNMFFFAVEELSLDMSNCNFYGDTADSYKEMIRLVGDINDIECLIIPSMEHFRHYDEICAEFMEMGIYIIEVSNHKRCFEY
ncbi:hypothetical protein [Sutcliffiella cohnii]|uniref:hypothetical protein n=1 Tax=Sutcliffiella cohnii TaxID=33932 RepID=UPI002E2470A9|nr:hypothetical protein [Sutcliffiella cohnii]